MTFFELMGKYIVSRNSDVEPSHVSMLPHGGIYNIPDDELEEFYKEYNAHIRNGAKYGILERPKDIGPMLVDVDISKETTEDKALYTEKRVKEYVLAFQDRLKENTNIENLEDLECLVLEKEGYFSNDKFKNGFHLHFPKIWMTKKHRTIITNNVLGNFTVKDFETLDSSASRNNWLLYKSRKTRDQEAYKLSYTISFDGQKSRKFPKKDSLVRSLSIRNNPTGFVYEVKSCFVPTTRTFRPKPKKSTDPLDEDLLDRCLNSLNDFRADEYFEWIRIGLILHTIDSERGLDRWKEFSKRSEKYNEYIIEKTWNGFRDADHYTVGTLIYLAKEDDPKFKVGVRKAYLKKELLEMCKKNNLKGYSTLSVSGLCSMLGLPCQPKNARGGHKKVHVRLLKGKHLKPTENKGKHLKTSENIGKHRKTFEKHLETTENI